jgi:hypothetical protein
VDNRPPVIDLHVRISRRFLFWAVTVGVVLFFILPLLWFALQTLGGTSHK